MTSGLLAEIIGPDILIVLAVVALLFGSTRLPKLARSLGSASSEFRKGLEHGADDADTKTVAAPEAVSRAPEAVSPAPEAPSPAPEAVGPAPHSPDPDSESTGP